jgi:PAS domain S-box-containing protein
MSMRHPLRIVSVEDDANDAGLIQDLLETEGIVSEMTRVDTQASLQDVLQQGGVDLILADYSLPSFDGISALKLANKVCPDVPFIFVSGTLGEEVAIEALKIGATDYVLKTSLSRLVPSLQRALREAAQKAERKRAEESLRQSETYLAEAQRLSHTGSFGWKPSTGAIIWSEETFRIFQYDRTAAPTVNLILQRVHPEDAAFVQQTIDRATQDCKGFEHAYRLLMPDGSVKHVHVVARCLGDESGGVNFVGAVMDVTAAKQAETTLREREAYLAEAQRLSHTGSWAWMIGSSRLFWSLETFRIFGFDPSTTTPTTEMFMGRVHPDDRASIELVETDLYKGNDAEFNYRIILPDSSIKYITSVGHPLKNNLGQVIEFVGTVMDVTERKQAEEGLRQAHADLARISRITTMGELTASLAHEVNQPIAAAVTDASTCLRWLARDPPDLEEARTAASRVVKDAARATEIMTRIRSLFKKEISQRELVDVNDIIREMIDLLRSEATRYSISMRTELSEDIPQIMGDRVQLQQVTLNLIINSFDAMKDVDGTRALAITSQRTENEQLQVSVSDTGIGLPSQRADEIFNAFFTTKPHGTGMGLRISRSIIESHGGRLWAADNFPCGACFAFTLPTKIEGRE